MAEPAWIRASAAGCGASVPLAKLVRRFWHAIERSGRPRRAQPGWRSPPGLELATQKAARACRAARWQFQNLPSESLPRVCPTPGRRLTGCRPPRYRAATMADVTLRAYVFLDSL